MTEIEKLPSLEYVRRLFTFDAEHGLLIWNERPASDFVDTKRRSAACIAATRNTQFAGKPAGKLDAAGYRHVKIDGALHRAHRLIWFHVKGEWPIGELDHVHGTSAGDVISNLRDVTHIENGKNQKMPCTNSSGTIGVTWSKGSQKWQAQIVVKQKRIYLGKFTSIADAIIVRRAAEIKHGFHPNHGLSADARAEKATSAGVSQ